MESSLLRAFGLRATPAFRERVIFDSPAFGRTLSLEGIVQTIEKDEGACREMIVHALVLTHGELRPISGQLA